MPRLPEAPLPDVGQTPSGGITDFRERANIRGEEGVIIEDQVGYGQGRTSIQYNQFHLEADRMVIDFVSGDIQAEGNVVFESPQQFIKASRGRFNMIRQEGMAYDVDGQSGPLYFRAVWDEEEKGPSFRQIDESQSIFRGTHFTTSSFPVPMYYIKSDEVILIKERRIFFRNPVLYIRGVPVLWLPFYTRNLAEGSPWSTEFGYNSDLGAFFRLGYRYIHRVQTPEWEDPTMYRNQSHGLLDTYVDLMSQRGVGAGARYTYQFDHYRHTGFLQVYGINDRGRDVAEEESSGDENQRWVYRHKHFSQLSRDLFFQLDVDQASDPDIYVDILDRFTPDTLFERGRLFEQSARAGLTYRKDDFIARLAVEHRERLGRDVYKDYSDPFSDDLDFDIDPDFTDGEDIDDTGIPRKRYGVVSKNAYARYATRLLNLGSTPLYYRFEANGFTSRDAGLNIIDTDDDTRVYGGDVYGSLTYRMRLGERTTWTNTVGVGSAYYYRRSNELVSEEELQNGIILPNGTITIPNAIFRDEETQVLGLSDTERSLDEVEPFYAFADYTSRLNHRFTDYLDGYVKYFIREGTDNSLGEYYEKIGKVEAREDIYDFYTDKHYVEAGLNYFLRYPNLAMSIRYRENLQRSNEIYPNEQIRFAGYSIGYTNDSREFQASLGLGFEKRRIRDRADPNSFKQGSLGGNLLLSYFPRHSRYWAQLLVSGSHKLEEDPVARDARQKLRFDEDETEFIITPTLGRRFGPKYRVQVSATYNTRFSDFERAGVIILRDLADAELGLSFGVRNDSIEARDDDEFDDSPDVDPNDRETEYELDVRASIRFKINRDQPGLGQRSITTLADLRREAQYVQ